MDIKIIIAIVAAVLVAAGLIIWFVKLPKDQKIKNLKEWLKWAVVEAERQLGAKTGQLKLRLVYNTAVNKFPFIVSFVSFETFSNWVDEALEWMKDQLEKNEAINEYINK